MLLHRSSLLYRFSGAGQGWAPLGMSAKIRKGQACRAPVGKGRQGLLPGSPPSTTQLLPIIILPACAAASRPFCFNLQGPHRWLLACVLRSVCLLAAPACAAGKRAQQVIKDDKWLKEEFTPTVANRGAALIKKWGRSSAASTAVSIADHLRSLYVPTAPGDCFSMAVCTDGNAYGIEEGIIFSMPCRSTGDGDYEVRGWEAGEG